ncbi:MAG: LamG domain-containing protein [Rhodoferax sp.]|nr:LamG domain-containing protein [Rhodoferax sp.]
MRWPTLFLVFLVLLLTQGAPRAATYTSASTAFEWVDPATHNKVGHLTTPYKFTGGGATGCGSVPPVLDDAISDVIPIGFTFTFGTTAYTSLRVQSNGRLQFGNTLCGFGTNAIGPPQTYPNLYPNGAVNNTMKVFGVDLDPTNLVNSPNYPSAARRTTCLSITTCYVSVATIGSAPNRRFVVTWKNVPEWVSASNTSGSFDLQVILNENGTFVYQYGNISHGGTGSAQVGWQLTTGDFEVLTFGASAEPPPNTAILFYVPSANPLAEYRFEQGAWSPGGAGQVADTSPGARGGTATGRAQATADGKVCRAASIPSNTAAATVDAIKTGVRFADAGVNMLGQGTIMFWYRANTAWSGGGAKSVQLLDATQTSGQWFSLTKTAAGTLFLEVTDSTGVVRSVETAAQTFAAGTWVHVAIRWNFNALAAANSDRIGILVNAAAPVQSSFTTTGSLATGLDFLSVGDNPSGLTGSKGSVNSADGTIDDLRIYNFELLPAQVSGASIQTYPCGSFAIDHFELRHPSWSGLACAPGTMTLVACANAACSSLYTQGVVATLSASGATTLWDPAAGGSSIVIGFGQSSTTRSFYTAAGNASFAVTGTGVPVMESSPHKCDGAAGACTWSSANGGLLMTLPDSGVITGGKPVAVTVQAVQSSGPTPGAACVPVQNLAATGLKVWSSPVTPAAFSGTSTSASVTVGGAPQVAQSAAGSWTTTPGSLPGSNNLGSLNFDATASTTVWLRHMDTGQFNLRATLDTAATATTPALSLAGSVGATSMPLGLGVAASGVAAPAAVQTACAAGGSASCDTAAGGSTRAGLAGDNFSATITAALWTADADAELSDNPVAPAFAGTMTLAPSLVAPLGGSAGSLGVTSVTLSAGTGTVASQRWTQAGALRITSSGVYLARPVSGQSAVLGRFSPRHFTSTVTTQGCGSFTYSGQPIQTVTVRAMDGATVPAPTPNYVGAFARTVTLSDASGTATGTFTAHTASPGAFAGGVATLSPVFTFAVARTAPASLVLRATDGEVSSAGNAEGSASVRSGRLHIPNMHGSELLPLPVPLVAQYWNGSAYTTNTLDNCTVVPASAIAMGNYQKSLAACDTRLTPAGNLSFAGGVPSGAGLSLTKPGLGKAGSVDLSLNTGSVPSGLTCVGASASAATGAGLTWFGTPATARATFGIFKSPLIYGRENY